MESNPQALLKTLLNELVKTRILLDGQDRPQFVYQARYNAKNGDVCVLTEYLYKDNTSTVIVGTKETEGVWLTAYDTGFTT